MIRRLANVVLRLGARTAHRLLKGFWFIRRPKTYGAHAVALTPAGKLVLVRLRYAKGWRLPGGGRGRSELPLDAALRELTEEIGMTAHGDAQLACELDEAVDFKRDTAALVIVRDVEYRPPRWSWEVEAVGEFVPNSLPSAVSPQTARWLRTVGDKL